MVPLSLISLPFFLLPWLTLAEDPIHIELQRRSSPQRRGFDYGKEAERVRNRYGYGATPSGRRRRATSSIPIINQVCGRYDAHECVSQITWQNADSSYLATISIGTP